MEHSKKRRNQSRLAPYLKELIKRHEQGCSFGVLRDYLLEEGVDANTSVIFRYVTKHLPAKNKNVKPVLMASKKLKSDSCLSKDTTNVESENTEKIGNKLPDEFYALTVAIIGDGIKLEYRNAKNHGIDYGVFTFDKNVKFSKDYKSVWVPLTIQ